MKAVKPTLDTSLEEVDDTEDIVYEYGLPEEEEGGFESTETTGSVFSISTYLTWKINSAWDLFYENKMLLGDQTSQWAYYQNQDQLHLGGIRYKFDINL